MKFPKISIFCHRTVKICKLIIKIEILIYFFWKKLTFLIRAYEEHMIKITCLFLSFLYNFCSLLVSHDLNLFLKLFFKIILIILIEIILINYSRLLYIHVFQKIIFTLSLVYHLLFLLIVYICFIKTRLEIYFCL